MAKIPYGPPGHKRKPHGEHPIGKPWGGMQTPGSWWEPIFGNMFGSIEDAMETIEKELQKRKHGRRVVPMQPGNIDPGFRDMQPEWGNTKGLLDLLYSLNDNIAPHRGNKYRYPPSPLKLPQWWQPKRGYKV